MAAGINFPAPCADRDLFPDRLLYLLDNLIRRMELAQARDGNEILGSVPQGFPQRVDHIAQVHLGEEDILQLAHHRPDLMIGEGPEGFETEKTQVLFPLAPEFLNCFHSRTSGGPISHHEILTTL